MRLITHVRRSSDGGFEVRMVVPADLRSTIGKTNLTRRLGRLSKSDANRLAAPVIQQFHALIELAKSGILDQTPSTPSAPVITPNVPPLFSLSCKLMVLFDGYVRERQPSPATIKRWRPVIAHLVEHLGHDDGQRASNRVENGRLPLRRSERAMLKFADEELVKVRLSQRPHPLQPGTPPDLPRDLQDPPLGRTGPVAVPHRLKFAGDGDSSADRR